jgi:CHAT domain-containing protein
MRILISGFLTLYCLIIFNIDIFGQKPSLYNFQSKLIVDEPILNKPVVVKAQDRYQAENLLFYICVGDSLYLKGAIDKACEFYSLGLNLSIKLDLKLQSVLFLNRLGFANYWLSNITQSYKFYTRSMCILENLEGIPDTIAYLETIYFNKLLSDKNGWNLEPQYNRFIENIDTDNFKGSRLTKLCFLLSSLYSFKGDLINMKKNTDAMKESLVSCKKNRDFWSFIQRLSETNYYMRMHLLEIESKYLFELFAQISGQPEFEKYQFEIKNLLGRYFVERNNLQKAINLLEEIRPFAQKDDHPYFYDYYLLLGYCYFKTMDCTKPNLLYKHAEKVLINNSISDSRLSIVYLCMAMYDCSKGLTSDISLNYWKKSAKIAEYSGKAYLTSYINSRIASFYMSQKDYYKAIEYYSMQLKDLDSLLSDSSYFITQIPRVIQFNISRNIDFRANCYYYLSKERNFDKKILLTAYEEKGKLIALWMKLFDYLESYEDYRINVLLSIKEAYDDQIEFGYDLYRVTKDEEWLNIIFSLSQKSKAFLLRSFINDRTSQKLSGIPDVLVQKSLNLRRELDRLQYSLNSASLLAIGKMNSEMQMSTVIDKYKEYNSFIKTLEEKYPVYASTKKKVQVLTVSQIQAKLEKDQALVEYQIGYAGLYTFYIDKENFKTFFYPIENDATDDLSADILKYRELILSGQSDNSSTGELIKMADQSKLLYKLLIGPFEPYIGNKRLIIIPDRELNTIPFETLIHPSFDYKEKYLFTNIPYLIRRNSICYMYSSSLLQDSTLSTFKNAKYAGFAPDYSVKNFKLKGDSSSLEVLPGAIDELKAARKYFRGRVFSGNKATKENFFSSMAGYDIVHIAMHTIIDENEPMNSEMIFSGQKSNDEGQLHAYEVYSHENNVKMAVLSSCNTGKGIVRAGEGIINIARAFFLAGVHNVILTQWSVSDKSSAELMKGFYKNLSAGDPTDIAMQKAKIDFLRKGDPVKMHPYYWSGYITYGTCTFVGKGNTARLILIILAVIVVCSLIVIRKFRT